jgi:hypothetical protein
MVDQMVFETASELPESAYLDILVEHSPNNRVRSSPGRNRSKQTADAEEASLPVSITIYVFTPKKASVPTARMRKAPPTELLQEGPFVISSTDTYIHCLRENIHETKIEWKPKKPQNVLKLTLGKSTGHLQGNDSRNQGEEARCSYRAAVHAGLGGANGEGDGAFFV